MLVKFLAQTMVCAGLFVGSFAHADQAQDLYDSAVKFFGDRATQGKVDLALQDLAKALTVVGTNAELKYKILILESRSQYWKGVHAANKDEKLKLFDLGMVAAENARKTEDAFAEAHYFYGINLARWAETKGILESLSRKKELMEKMDATIDRETLAGELGQELDGYGADRVYGRMYFKLPSFAGGSRDLSLKHLGTAVQNAKTTVLNVVYYAETLHAGNNNDKAAACKMLADLTTIDYETYNPARVPETKEELAEGAKLYKDICK